MIPKRIDREEKSDNYRALALYAADAKIGHISGEKTFHHWYAGGDADNYLEGMIEVEATQAMNTRAEGEKTYHLMVSFRPEDEDKLTSQVLEEIETMLADALGFSGHQRHCGVHVNTNNMHLHVAYNMIEPRKFTKHFPYYDYPKLHKACRAIEKKYGLAVDKGMEPDSPAKSDQPKAKVKAIEAQTGQESFHSYVLRRKPELMTGLEKAASWPDVHQVFLQYGLILKVSGNGLAIKDRYGKHPVKASALDRTVSKKNLEARFGPFESPAPALFQIPADERFTAAPLHKGVENSALYAEFREETSRRKTILYEIRRDEWARISEIRERVARQREKIKRLPMYRHDRRLVTEKIRKKENDAIKQIREESNLKREKVRKEIPFTTWIKYLQHTAAHGNETALAILRSKNAPTTDNGEIASLIQSHQVNIDLPKANSRAAILERHGLSNHHRRALLAVIKMREIIKADDKSDEKAERFRYTIDGKGTLIFKLPDGGTIRDTGREINFSVYGKGVKEIAEKYARAIGGRVKKAGQRLEQEQAVGMVNLTPQGQSR